MFQPDRALSRCRIHQVEFVVIGGMAAVAHGAAIVTPILDVCYNPTLGNRRRIVEALKALNPYARGVPPGLPFFWDERTLTDAVSWTLTTDAGDLNLLTEVSGVGKFEQVKAHSQPMEIFGMSLDVLSLEGLIAAKEAAGRTKDLMLLPQLRALQALQDELGSG